jgi:hypothetical protein
MPDDTFRVWSNVLLASTPSLIGNINYLTYNTTEGIQMPNATNLSEYAEYIKTTLNNTWAQYSSNVLATEVRANSVRIADCSVVVSPEFKAMPGHPSLDNDANVIRVRRICVRANLPEGLSIPKGFGNILIKNVRYFKVEASGNFDSWKLYKYIKNIRSHVIAFNEDKIKREARQMEEKKELEAAQSRFEAKFKARKANAALREDVAHRLKEDLRAFLANGAIVSESPDCINFQLANGVMARIEFDHETISIPEVSLNKEFKGKVGETSSNVMDLLKKISAMQL